jgi:protein-S-isoprenylcysteine O-methyltransferase Ste14
MNNSNFFLLVGVCVLAHFIRTVYEILKHKKIVVASKLSFAIIFTNMAILWISWFTLCSFDVYKINLPAIVRYFGIAINLLGAILFFTALFTIKTLEVYDGDLIIKGIYSKVRHPMYLGFSCWLIGTPVFYGAVFSFILAVLFIANVLFWRHLEEIELEKRFPGYKGYKLKTLF